MGRIWTPPWVKKAEPAAPEPVIDITVPRECVYQQFEGQPGPCPRCGGPLYQSSQTYMVATRRGTTFTDTFILGSDFGWFCGQCPTVVINPEAVSEMLQHHLPHWDVGDRFAVLGVIDLDAVPEDKRHLPLGDDDNPIPLVRFTVRAAEPAAGSVQKPRPRPPAPTRKKKKKRRR